MPRAMYPPCEIEGAKRCTWCGRVKPFDAFDAEPRMRDGRRSHCRVCRKPATAARKQAPQYREQAKAYEATPERRAARQAERDRDRMAIRERQANYRKTPMARMLNSRRAAGRRLRRADDPKKRARLEVVVAAWDREIDRIRAKRQAEDDAIPTTTLNPRKPYGKRKMA